MREDELVRLDVAGRALSVEVSTIKKYCRCGLLRCLKLPGGHWRVWRSSIEEVRKSGETATNRV